MQATHKKFNKEVDRDRQRLERVLSFEWIEGWWHCFVWSWETNL